MNKEVKIMNIKKLRNSLYHKTPLKILSFLSMHPGVVFSAQEISAQTRSSKGATNQTLRLFLASDILSREQKGNLFLYRLNLDSFVLKQFKIFENVLDLQKLIQELRPYCSQIILFGSCADGSNAKESDVDLFIKSEYKSEVSKLINNHEDLDFKISPVIQDTLESIATKKTDRVFFEQVKKGITLWEGKPTHEEV